VRVPAHPRLYDAQPDVPVLNGTRCRRCRTAYFPPMDIGCEVCGATDDDLQPTLLAAAGVVHSLAEVHVHQGTTVTPFTIAEVLLAAGPLIRAMLAPGCRVGIGDSVSAVWSVAHRDDAGDDVVEPVFAPAPPWSGGTTVASRSGAG
jgi:uncharacterized protein